MKKTQGPWAKLTQNLRNLIPYVGVLFVVAGIIGLLFIQQPLKTSQDTRSEAQFTDSKVIGITPELRTPFEVDRTGEVAFNLINNDNGSSKFTKINIVFSIANKYIETPEVMVNQGSGYEHESIEIQQISDGYLVEIVAIPHDKRWLVEPTDKSLIRVKLVPKKTGELFINFDKDRTHGELGNQLIFISTPAELKYEITGYGDTEPPATNPPATTPPIQGCNETCNNNGECAMGMRCYSTGGDSRCRLATNPTSTQCHQASNEVSLKSCNQSCSNNAECATGLTCYQDSCRNPENSQNSSCAAPTTSQTAAIIQSCGETCSTNRDCAINLTCYEGECRLATNKSSTSCSAVTTQTVSDTYSNKAEDATSTAEVVESDTPLQKGDTSIFNKDLSFEDQENALADKKEYDDEHLADETLLDLAKNLILNSESRLPFFIILFGVMLLVLSILAALISRLKKPKYSPPRNSNALNKNIDVKSYAVKPGEAPRNSATKDLLKTLENQPKA